MLSPSFMITPAPRKPTPVTTPCTTRVGSARTCPALPPYQKGGLAHEYRERGRGHADQAVGAHARGAAVVRTLVAHQHAQQQRAEQVQGDEAVGGEEGAAPVVLEISQHGVHANFPQGLPTRMRGQQADAALNHGAGSASKVRSRAMKRCATSPVSSASAEPRQHLDAKVGPERSHGARDGSRPAAKPAARVLCDLVVRAGGHRRGEPVLQAQRPPLPHVGTQPLQQAIAGRALPPCSLAWRARAPCTGAAIARVNSVRLSPKRRAIAPQVRPTAAAICRVRAV